MFCTNCGQHLTNSEKVCPSCGKQLFFAIDDILSAKEIKDITRSGIIPLLGLFLFLKYLVTNRQMARYILIASVLEPLILAVLLATVFLIAMSVVQLII